LKNSKKGSQGALFNDREVRREYLKDKQWVDSHMRVKVHITGFACAYEAVPMKPKNPDRSQAGRWQGSLFNQQKHAIADGVEWIRRNSRFKPRIWVMTTPGYIEAAREGSLIKELTANLRNGYGMGEYVWVRELTKKGFPHFHFVGDIDQFDPVKLSLYWSGLFGKTAKNSVRLGTRPDKNGRRKFWVNSAKMAWYMSKYIGKDLEKPAGMKRRPYRTFAISQRARRESQPLLYVGQLSDTWRGLKERQFTLSDEQVEEGLPQTVNPHNYRWKWTGHGQTYCGFLREPTEK
jgi:hypothetical protein